MANLNLQKFIINNELVIKKEDWLKINSEWDRDDIKQALSDTIKDLPLPYASASKEKVENDFIELINLDSQSLFNNGDWFSRYDYRYPFSSTYVKINKTGSWTSNFFHQKNRWKCDSINAPSPERTWSTEKFRLTLLNGLWTQKADRIDNKTLRTCIGLRKYIAAQFRPSAAKAIYEYFNSERVLDISSGWGDRLSGFLASKSTTEYVGFDPNHNLQEGYKSQFKKWSELLNHDKKFSITPIPFEDVTDLPADYFDLVFTSPPYFRVERYTHDSNQSWKRYTKIDQWLEYFLFASLRKAWYSLKSGGYIAINISDVYMNHTVNNICDPMNEFIEKNLGGINFNSIGYQMAKRPRSNSNREGIFCEPIWIWQKP